MLFRARLASASLSDWGEAMLTSKVIGVRQILVESAGQEMVLGGTWDRGCCECWIELEAR